MGRRHLLMSFFGTYRRGKHIGTVGNIVEIEIEIQIEIDFDNNRIEMSCLRTCGFSTILRY